MRMDTANRLCLTKILSAMTQFELDSLNMQQQQKNPGRYIDHLDEFRAHVCASISSIFCAK